MIKIAPPSVTPRVTHSAPVTAAVTLKYACPVCGHRIKAHPTKAAKQKAYRERKKSAAFPLMTHPQPDIAERTRLAVQSIPFALPEKRA